MFIETLKKTYGYNTPIFTDEILSLFLQYTRAYVFRLLKAAEVKGEIFKVDTGIYYLPQMTPFGPSVITAADVVKKKYLEDFTGTYGIYSGLMLQNAFSLTTQITNIPEIITNRASSRCRTITIDGMQYILRKSRVEITSENACAYRVLQLFTETNGIEINETAKKAIAEYIIANNIKPAMLLELAKSFPAKTLQKMIYSGVLEMAFNS